MITPMIATASINSMTLNAACRLARTLWKCLSIELIRHNDCPVFRAQERTYVICRNRRESSGNSRAKGLSIITYIPALAPLHHRPAQHETNLPQVITNQFVVG